MIFLLLSNIADSRFNSSKWITQQIQFRFGKWYDKFVSRSMSFSPDVFALSEPGSLFTVKDFKNSSFYWRDREVLQVAKKHNVTNNDVYFHVNMNDYQHNTGLVFSHNRPFKSDSTILFPVHSSFHPSHFIEDQVPYINKTPLLFFRGSTTGPIDPLKPNSYGRQNNRLLMLEALRGLPYIDAYFYKVVQNDSWSKDIVDRVNSLLKPPANRSSILSHKFILCLEGNDWSSFFFWALASHSCPFHTYPFTSEAIHFSGIIPWVHFIPVSHNGSDVYEKVLFCLDNDHICNAIALNGFKYMRPFLNTSLYNDIHESTFRLYERQSWGRLFPPKFGHCCKKSKTF